MAVFEYKAIDLDAGAVAGTITADTPRQARDVLRERGLTVTDVASTQEELSNPRKGRPRRLRSQGEVTMFVRELSALLTTGIPLLQALQTLAKQHHRRFKTVIQRVADQVTGGSSLAEAMVQHPAYFDDITTNAIRVGENTGSLEVALKRLAQFKEKGHRLRNRVTTALMYPMVVVVIGLAVTVFLMTYVVPILLETLTQSGRPLPAITAFVKAMSDILLGWWWLILLAVSGAVAGLVAMNRNERGQFLLHRFILSVPLVGQLVRKESVSRMAVVLAALLRSNLQFIDAIEITRRTIHNRVFQDALVDYKAAIASGKDVAGPLEASGVFSPMVIQMLAIGQETGQLEEMLDQLAETYDREVDTAVDRLTAVLEPVLIIFLAILVGFVAMATLLPILESSNVL
ncbi:hypothetical protein LCGC14_0409220 [marine sediment metagenome]|uniref:Type II secretion system protein GspF domain-containing protein n=1 Tax=marine sediment metagenome TaxID=412755 RepID=A0A0F9TCC8_9ZZZZ|nr:type II secretion system F family protein [Phycisphaerae bacterium]HDZ44314.1 type II secretion system F family protein [Phycisphaerae bacterium]